MPTFKKDIKIGTMIPLIKTDDISNGAITKEKLDKDLREQIQPKKTEKAKKRRKQILIGKAIKSGSMLRTDVENWYAFIKDPCFMIYKKYGVIPSDIHVFTKLTWENEYKEVGVTHSVDDSWGNQRVCFKGDTFAKYKVDNYIRTDNSFSIYLTYKYCPVTLKGQSITKEWKNGKRVNSKKINIEQIKEDLKNWIQNGKHLYYFEYRRITSRNKRFYTSYNGSKVKTRREVSCLNNKSKRKAKLSTGLYKVRINKTGFKTEWQTIYVKINTRYGLMLKGVFFR